MLAIHRNPVYPRKTMPTDIPAIKYMVKPMAIRGRIFNFISYTSILHHTTQGLRQIPGFLDCNRSWVCGRNDAAVRPLPAFGMRAGEK